MSSEERAREIAQHFFQEGGLRRALAAQIAGALDAAVAAERERCAQVAESFTRAPMDYRDWSPGPAADDRALNIANAIRAGRAGE
jgi:hypothetical protein